MYRLRSAPVWGAFYIALLTFLLSVLSHTNSTISFTSLFFLFLCHLSLFLILLPSRFLTTFFSIFLLFLLMGYITIKKLGLVPPVDDTLALMFLFQSNWDEIKDFLSWQILLAIVLAFILAYILTLPFTSPKNPLWNFSAKTRTKISIVSLVFLFFLYPQVRDFLPYSFWNISLHFSLKKNYQSSLTLSSPKKAPSLIYFIGESLRGDHLSINGYHKKTTPHLEHLSLVNFGVVYSCATYTKASWLYLTQRDNCQDAVQKQESMAKLFKGLGYHAYFDALNDVPAEEQLLEDSDKRQLITRSQYRLDIPFMKTFFPPKSLVILGHRGSHYNYKTYPLNNPTFTPVCGKTKFVEMSKYCTVQEVVNDYDNTIVQLDLSIYHIIQQLKTRKDPIIFVFTSDHGEMLGENGIWAHGFSPKLKETHMVPLFFWFNDAYKHLWPGKYHNILKNSQKFFGQAKHDNLWFSLLDGIGVVNRGKDKILKTTKSLFSDQYRPNIKKGWDSPDYPRH